jgi:hypothetical protein
VAALLPGALAAATKRHAGRRAGWEADLSGVEVGRPDPYTVLVRCPAGGSTSVDEVLRVEPHPVRVEGDGPVLVAEQAGLRLDLPDLDAVTDATFRDQLDHWLDLAVAALAIRVAAEAE